MTGESVATYAQKFGNICRICLKESKKETMSSIFTKTRFSSNSEDESVLAARIASIAQVQIDPSDGLPPEICQICHDQVNKFYDFRLLVEISDRTLRSCYNVTQEERETEGEMVTLSIPTNMEYQEFYIDDSYQLKSDKDPTMTAILIPSSNGMQVWQICNVAETDPILPDNEINYKNIEKKTLSIASKSGYPSEPVKDSDIDDFEGVKRCLAAENLLTTSTSAMKIKEVQIETVINEENDQEEHLIQEEYSCQLCFQSFDSLDSLKIHVSEHFVNGNKNIPRKFHKESVYNPLQEEESSELDDIENQTCQSYDQSFKTNIEMICNEEGIKRKKGIRKNRTRYSRSTENEEKRRNVRHICVDCGKEFSKRSVLRYHAGTHTNSPISCTICNKKFRNEQSYKMHAKRHTLGSRFNCIECGKSYYTNSELARHVQQHTGMREYPCHLCDMSFLSRPELNRHFKYHSGEKKFECKICLKTYYESGHLKVHERVHTGEKPFACTVCNKAFITKSKLVRHLKIHDPSR